MAVLHPQDKPISREGQFAHKKGQSHNVVRNGQVLTPFQFLDPISPLLIPVSVSVISYPFPPLPISSLPFYSSSSISPPPFPFVLSLPHHLLLSSSSSSLSSFFPPSSLPPSPCFTDVLSKSTCSCSSLPHVLSATKPPFNSSQFQIPPKNLLTQPCAISPKTWSDQGNPESFANSGAEPIAPTGRHGLNHPKYQCTWKGLPCPRVKT